MKQEQNFDIPSDNNIEIIVTITDEDTGLAIDLTGATVYWWAARNVRSGANDILIKKDTTAGVTLTDAVNGIITVALVPADTAGIDGDYYHEVKVVLQNGKEYTTTTGILSIKPTLINVP